MKLVVLGVRPRHRRHIKGARPRAFERAFTILCLWSLVDAIVSSAGGWLSLAKLYCRVPFNAAKWRMQSGRMRGLTNHNNVLTLGVSPEGCISACPFFGSELGPGVRLRNIHDGARVGNPFPNSRVAGG
jgi:hypothetical protein